MSVIRKHQKISHWRKNILLFFTVNFETIFEGNSIFGKFIFVQFSTTGLKKPLNYRRQLIFTWTRAETLHVDKSWDTARGQELRHWTWTRYETVHVDKNWDTACGQELRQCTWTRVETLHVLKSWDSACGQEMRHCTWTRVETLHALTLMGSNSRSKSTSLSRRGLLKGVEHL